MSAPSAHARIARLVVASTLVLAACQHQGAAPEVVHQGRRVQFDPTDAGRLLVVERDGGVGLWRVDDPLHPRGEHQIAAQATDARFLPGAQGVVSAGADGRVRRWQLNGAPVWTSVEKHTAPVRGLAVGPADVASAGEDGAIRLWRFNGAPAGTIDAGGGMVLAVAFSPRGDWLAAETADTRLRLWHREAPDAPLRLAATFREANARYVALLPNLIHYDVGWGWDRSLAFAPNAPALAAADFTGEVQRWNLNGVPIGDALRSASKQHIRAIDVAPDGQLAAALYDGTVQVWPADGRAPVAFTVGEGVTTGVAFAPDGKHVAAASLDSAVTLWNPAGSPAGALPAAPREEPTR